MNASTRLATLAVCATAILAVQQTAASAAVPRHKFTDQRGDAPAAIDILWTKGAPTRNALTVTTKVRNLGKKGTFDITTAWDSTNVFRVRLRHAGKKVKATGYDEGDGEDRRRTNIRWASSCKIKPAWSTKKNTVTVSFPDACVGYTHWPKDEQDYRIFVGSQLNGGSDFLNPGL